MIRIVCTPSPLTLLPIRALLRLIGFTPQSVREHAAYTLIYPFSARYRKVLGSLSYIERVPEAQVLGVVTQWRVRRWMMWLARSIAPLIEGKKLFFYAAEHIDEPTKIFLQILSSQVLDGAVSLVFGPSSKCGVLIADTASYALAEEQGIVRLLLKNNNDITSAETTLLEAAAVGCVLSANYWQACRVAKKMVCHQPVNAHHLMGLAHVFFNAFANAEWHYAQARDSAKPLDRVKINYALAALHLRFYPPVWRDYDKAAEYIRDGYATINTHSFAQEAHIFMRLMVDGMRALFEFRQRNFEIALAIISSMLSVIETIPESERSECCLVTVLGNKAQLLRAMGRLEEVVSINEHLVVVDAQQPLWWIEYVKSLLDLGKLDRVSEVLGKGLALHYDSAELHSLQGEYYRKTGCHAQSAKSFTRAARYAPDVPRYRERVLDAKAREKERGLVLF